MLSIHCMLRCHVVILAYRQVSCCYTYITEIDTEAIAFPLNDMN